MADLNELKAKINILDYIKQNNIGKIEKVGNHEYRLNPCPVCGGKDHFTIYEDSNSYSSFSDCCKGGTIIDYFINVERMSKEDSIKKLYELTNTVYKPSRTSAKEDFRQSTNNVQIDTKEKQQSREEVERIRQFILKNIEISNINIVAGMICHRGLTIKTIDKYKMFISSDNGKQRLYIPIFEKRTTKSIYK